MFRGAVHIRQRRAARRRTRGRHREAHGADERRTSSAEHADGQIRIWKGGLRLRTPENHHDDTLKQLPTGKQAAAKPTLARTTSDDRSCVRSCAFPHSHLHPVGQVEW